MLSLIIQSARPYINSRMLFHSIAYALFLPIARSHSICFTTRMSLFHFLYLLFLLYSAHLVGVCLFWYPPSFTQSLPLFRSHSFTFIRSAYSHYVRAVYPHRHKRRHSHVCTEESLFDFERQKKNTRAHTQNSTWSKAKHDAMTMVQNEQTNKRTNKQRMWIRFYVEKHCE